MKKKLLAGIVFNLMVFTAVLYTKNITILLFIGGIYIVPAVVNLISMKVTEYEYPIYLLPLITTITYGVFSYLLMQKQSFIDFVVNNSKEIGDISVQINGNLLGFGPLLFVFLINFSLIYLSYKLTRRTEYANS